MTHSDHLARAPQFPPLQLDDNLTGYESKIIASLKISAEITFLVNIVRM